MANTGKASEERFIEHVEAQGGFVLRMQDLFDASKQRLATGRKASDFIVTDKDGNAYVEVKSIEDKDVFKFSGIQTEQWRVATRVTRAGGSYYFVLHFMAFDKWCKVPAEVILNHDKKSIKLKEVDRYQFQLAA